MKEQAVAELMESIAVDLGIDDIYVIDSIVDPKERAYKLYELCVVLYKKFKISIKYEDIFQYGVDACTLIAGVMKQYQ